MDILYNTQIVRFMMYMDGYKFMERKILDYTCIFNPANLTYIICDYNSRIYYSPVI